MDDDNAAARQEHPRFRESLPQSAIEIKAEKPDPPETDDLEAIKRGMWKEIELLNDSRRNQDPKAVWKCRYCPYNAPSSVVLCSHYQFHLQLLTSQCKYLLSYSTNSN